MFDVLTGVSTHNHQLDGTRYGERCTCCPYGYHIDLDFLRYLDSLYSGESLKSLRRIRHSRSGGLTVSTSDGFFSDDDLARWRLTSSLSPVPSPQPRSGSSASQVTTDEILMEIDSSMSHTLHTINNEVDTRVIRKKKPPRPLPESRPKENGHRSAPEEQPIQQVKQSSQYSEVTKTTVTSTELADKFTGLMSGATSPVVGEWQSQQVTSPVSPEILQAIREQMAVSLQRMRELEDQVRVMPQMEDQISTLRAENKRLYHLLSRLTEDEQARGTPTANGDSGLHVEGDENVRTFRGEQGSILVELPVKVGNDDVSSRSSYSMHTTETRTEVRETNASARRAFFWGTPEANDTSRLSPESLRLFKPSRTIGVGDGNVFEVNGLLDWPAWRKTRDVGVHCLPPSRDVSVSISEATGEELGLQEEAFSSGGARVSLTVTVSDERRACEPRWEVERYGTGLYQDVAIQCLIIGGFLSSDRPHMSENVDGWLVETNKLWTSSVIEESRSSLVTDRWLERDPVETILAPPSSPTPMWSEEKQQVISAESLSPEEQSVSAVKVERQSASLDGVLDKLYQTMSDTEVDDGVKEEIAVPAHANPSAFDLNASFKKLAETAEAQDDVVKEDMIVAQSKPRVLSSCTDRTALDFNVSFAKLQQVQEPTVEEDVIVPKSAAPRASSRHVESLEMDSLVNKQVSSDSQLTLESKETSLQREEKESSIESTGEQRPFPPHLTRIKASSVSDDDVLGDQQQQQHDVTTSTHSVTVVEATESSQPGTEVTQQLEISVLPETTLSTQTSSVSDDGVVITKTEITREVTEVMSGSEVTREVRTSSVETASTCNITSGSAEATQDLTETSHTASTVVTSEVGEVQQSSGEVGNVNIPEITVSSESEAVHVSSDEIVNTESTVVTAEVSDVQQLPGETVHDAEAGDVTAADQSQGCHIIITETRIERQLIGSDADQSQPIIIVPEDTVIQ